jgi:hypothetical protein
VESTCLIPSTQRWACHDSLLSLAQKACHLHLGTGTINSYPQKLWWSSSFRCPVQSGPTSKRLISVLFVAGQAGNLQDIFVIREHGIRYFKSWGNQHSLVN